MSKQNAEKKVEIEQLPKCGIVMPISTIEDCSADHWADILLILRDVISSANFEPNLVSNADDSGIIQKRIIQNLYNNEMVVCDVSCKNPNVMFELGIRLAFDKPTIIIKDDITDFSFDTSVIEHLTYPRDLRFSKIVLFKENLKNKIEATYAKAKSDTNYSTFLKSFGQFTIASLGSSEISSDKYIVNTLETLKDEIIQIKRSLTITSSPNLSEREIFFDMKNKLQFSVSGLQGRILLEELVDDYLLKNKLTKQEVNMKGILKNEILNHLLNNVSLRKLTGGDQSKVIYWLNDYLKDS